MKLTEAQLKTALEKHAPTTGPLWVFDDLARELTPPPYLVELAMERSAKRLLEAVRSLGVLTSRRYQADALGTKCNVFTTDAALLLNAPLPRKVDGRWIRANEMIDRLRAGLYVGWSRVLLGDVDARAALGLPTVAAWKNPRLGESGHLAIVVPRHPLDKPGIHVTTAGRTNVQEAPIAASFGSYTSQVEFYGYER